MPIINQPFQGQLGTILINELSNSYNGFTIFSAFAKNSGVLRLKPSMETFKANGGKITAFIGIDLDGTSYEALLNLFNLCDDLYVIHSENFSTTFHSKIYLLENSTNVWCAIGSNNLTGGGLWTNFESCSIQNFPTNTACDELDNLRSLTSHYEQETYVCSTRISSIDDINLLLDCNYITKEVNQRVKNISNQIESKKAQKSNKLFGSEKISIPTLLTIEHQHNRQNKKTAEKSHATPVDYIFHTSKLQPAFTNEQFWFEMRESTGGSRNILDLSKLGKIVNGSVRGTSYEYSDTIHMYGGVKFFDLDPEDTTTTKDIIINYLGKDYYPSTIKFAPNNGSWRIQLKGSPNDNTDELSKFGNRGAFVRKILVFEKISTNYYVLSLLDESELDHLKSISQVWARNGNNTSSKAYGML